MKRNFLLIVMLCIINIMAFAAVPNADSLKKAQAHQAALQIQQHKPTPQAHTDTAKSSCCGVAGKNKDQDIGWGWVLVFLPMVLFFTFFGITLYAITRETKDKDGKVIVGKFNLTNALSESGYNVITKDNEKFIKENLAKLIELQELNTSTTLSILNLFPPTVSVTDCKYRPSISRLIAFLTSMLSLVVGLCLTSFFIYSYLKYCCVPDITKLSAVLVSLGIGVVPYAFNKVSNALGAKGTANQ